jgi:4-amino-4-deoxy-L-arabinose transferase-like glycosyltransferase
MMRRFHVTATIGLLLALCLLAFVFQGSRGIWQPDEGYYVGTAVTMLHKHTLLVPYLGEEEIFLDKPPMVYWSVMAGLKLLGHTEFAARFVHGLVFVLTALATGAAGWRLCGSRRAGFLSAFVYATMCVPFFAGNVVTPDGLVTLWTTVAMLCFWMSLETGTPRAWWQMLLCLAVGLGFLAKGPAVLIPCGAMAVFLLIRRQMLRYFLRPQSLLGLAIFLAVGLGWYAHISAVTPGALAYFFDSQVWGRLVSGRFNRNPGFSGALIYVPIILLGTLPWSAIWLGRGRMLLATVLRPAWWWQLRNRPAELLLACWFIVPMAVLCVSSSKLGFYALPVFPAIAIAIARVWNEKLPVVTGGFHECMAAYRRPAAVCCVVVTLLIVAKFVFAAVPSSSDMRVLWGQLQDKLPAGRYELGTVDRRADGLLFYGVMELEHLTDEKDPYPTFSGTKHVLDELNEQDGTDESRVLLVMGENQTRQLCTVLADAGISFDKVPLPYSRSLLLLHKPVSRPDSAEVTK